jgi:phosphoglycolate phosphatase-like HAD superfamily hydrolase
MNDPTNQIEEESRIRSAAFNLTETSGVGMLVFDCDGTILPYVEKVHALCVAKVIKEASERAGIGYTKIIFNELWQQELGKGIQHFFEKYAENLGGIENKLFMAEIGTVANAERLYEDTYIDFAQQSENSRFFRMRNGLLDVFAAAAKAKVPMAVLSNANERVLRQSLRTGLDLAGQGDVDLKDIFAAVVGKDMVKKDGNQAKPHPSSILSVKSRVEEVTGAPVSLPNSIFFGDTLADYNAAKNAGTGRVIACDNTLEESEGMSGPDQDGFVVVGQHHNLCEALALYQTYPTQRHHDPYLKPPTNQ